MTENHQRPADWPIAHPVDIDAIKRQHADEQRYVQLAEERARFHVPLGSIRADLEDQPSPASVNAAARRWCSAITAMAGEISNAKRSARP